MYLLYKFIELLASFMPFLLFSYLADSILDKSDQYRKRYFVYFGLLYLLIVIGVAAFVHNLIISVLAMFLSMTMVYMHFSSTAYPSEKADESDLFFHKQWLLHKLL